MIDLLIPDIQEMQSRINQALKKLYDEDSCLIINNTSERAITHKLAIYIQELFPEWHVDCEYNRKDQHLPKALLKKKVTFPDIIIHQRNSRVNLLVVEAESIHNEHPHGIEDKKKIEAYITDQDYQYCYGLWIRFQDEFAKTEPEWYEKRGGKCEAVKNE